MTIGIKCANNYKGFSLKPDILEMTKNTTAITTAAAIAIGNYCIGIISVT